MPWRRSLAVVVACAVAFTVLGARFGTADRPPWPDRQLLEATVDASWGLAESASRVLGTIGMFAVMMPLSLAVGWWTRRRGATLAAAVAVPVSLWTTAVTTSALKSAYDRARPPAELHLGVSSSAAFPSGHASYAAALVVAGALALGSIAGAKGTAGSATRGIASRSAPWAGALLVATMGLSRVVLRVHWLSDVVAGWLLGAAVGISVHIVVGLLAVASTGATHRVNETGPPRS